MENHDQRFKVLLKEFLPEFVGLFFPDLAAKLDFTRIEWLPVEGHITPPTGDTVEADLLAKVATRAPVPPLRHGEGESCLALIHVEIESPDRVSSFRHRMFDFYTLLRRDYNMPVVPITLFLRVGMEGIGWDVYEEVLWGRSVLRFEYAYVGLPALEAETYLSGASALGAALAALMKVPKAGRVELKARTLKEPPWKGQPEWRRYLLTECFDTYFPLDDVERAEYERIIQTEAYREVKHMTMGWWERGQDAEARKLLTNQLTKRFGPLGEHALARLKAMSLDQMEEMSLSLLDAKSLRDLGLEEASEAAV